MPVGSSAPRGIFVRVALLSRKKIHPLPTNYVCSPKIIVSGQIVQYVVPAFFQISPWES